MRSASGVGLPRVCFTEEKIDASRRVYCAAMVTHDRSIGRRTTVRASAGPKCDPVLVNLGAAVDEEPAQILGIETAILLAIEAEPDPATGIQPRLKVVEKK